MKRTMIALCLVIGLSGSLSADQQKTFTLTVDPSDATIKVISGRDLKEQVLRSPATVSATVAADPDRAKQNVIEITRDGYKPVVLPLRSVQTGEVLKIRLEKLKRLRFRMVEPKESDAIMIMDGQIRFTLRIDERQFQMSVMNNTAYPIRLLWQRASYTDLAGQQHRIMHSGIHYEERNRSFPYQTVMPFMTIYQAVMPVDLVVHDQQKKGLESQPLFPADAGERMKGKTFELTIPIEVENKGVVPYTFKVKVLGWIS